MYADDDLQLQSRHHYSIRDSIINLYARKFLASRLYY